MSGAVQRLVAAFVSPVEEAEPARGEWLQPTPPRPAAVSVLTPPDRAVAAGGAVALGLATGPVVVSVWGTTPRGPRSLASPGARRVATKLGDRGHDVAATGRLVFVGLADGPDEAARVAAAADTASVLVVAGPRDADVDRVLHDHDRVLVAGDDLVAALALDSVRALGVVAESLALPESAAARVLATSGVALVAPWRAPVDEALA